MPSLPNVPNVLRVQMQGHVGIDADWITRFHLQYSGTAPTSAQLNALAGVIRAGWGTNLKALLPASAGLDSVSIEDLSSLTAAVGIDTTGVVGTRAGSLIPGGTAVVVSYRIARRYKGGHPRGYWVAGVSADLGDAQQWAGAFLTAFQTGIDAFFAAAIGTPWTGGGTLAHCNVSYYHGFTVVTNPTTGRARNVPTLRGTPVVDLVTARVAQDNLGTQRRRN